MRFNTKRLFSVLLTVVMVAALSLPLFAAVTPTTFSASVGKAEAGKEVRVTLKVSDNAGFANGIIKVAFDTSVLEYKAYSDESMMASAITAVGTKVKGAVSYAFVLLNNTTENGALCTFVFNVLPGSEGKTSPVNISVEELVDGNSDANVPFKTVNTTLTVENKTVFTRGDVDGNGKITLADAMYIVEHVAKKNFLPSSWELPSDVNGDGEITLDDSSAIILFVARKTDKL